jgi:Ca2+-binding EF-hand superfamily protein
VLAALDLHGHGWVCAEDLFIFMKNFGIDVTIRQVEKLVEVVNCNSDGKITSQQLRWTVEGLENKSKTYLGKVKKSNKK